MGTKVAIHGDFYLHPSASGHQQLFVSKQEDVKQNTPAQAFAIEARDGTVWLGEDKYKNNGRFGVECRFYILVGSAQLTLLSINSLYYAYGCPSMRLYEDSLTVGAQKVDLAADGEIHNNLILPAGGRSAIRYFTPLRPPLMSTQPADCDGGDLLISLSWRTDAMLKTQKTKVIFLFNTQSRKMELSDFVREPSRLTESELREWLKEEKITEYEFNQLLEVSSIDRYFIAFSDNSSRPYELSMPLARKLRKLVGNHHKFFGYEDY